MAAGDIILEFSNFRVQSENETGSHVVTELAAIVGSQLGAAKATFDLDVNATGWGSPEGPLQFGKNYTITVTEQ